MYDDVYNLPGFGRKFTLFRKVDLFNDRSVAKVKTNISTRPFPMFHKDCMFSLPS